MKEQILEKLNELIDEEKGQPVGMNDMFLDSKLDSLGATLTLIALDAEYNCLEGVEEGEELDGVENLTVRELVKKCVLSSKNTSTEQKSGMDT